MTTTSTNRGNFANNPARAREAGRQGGKNRGKWRKVLAEVKSDLPIGSRVRMTVAALANFGGPHTGVVSGPSRMPDRFRVRRDGRATEETWNRSFWEPL